MAVACLLLSLTTVAGTIGVLYSTGPWLGETIVVIALVAFGLVLMLLAVPISLGFSILAYSRSRRARKQRTAATVALVLSLSCLPLGAATMFLAFC